MKWAAELFTLSGIGIAGVALHSLSPILLLFWIALWCFIFRLHAHKCAEQRAHKNKD